MFRKSRCPIPPVFGRKQRAEEKEAGLNVFLSAKETEKEAKSGQIKQAENGKITKQKSSKNITIQKRYRKQNQPNF